MAPLTPVDFYGDDGWYSALRFLNKLFSATPWLHDYRDFEPRPFRLPPLPNWDYNNQPGERLEAEQNFAQLILQEELEILRRPADGSMINENIIRTRLLMYGPLWTQLPAGRFSGAGCYKHIVICGFKPGESFSYLILRTRKFVERDAQQFVAELKRIDPWFITKSLE